MRFSSTTLVLLTAIAGLGACKKRVAPGAPAPVVSAPASSTAAAPRAVTAQRRRAHNWPEPVTIPGEAPRAVTKKGKPVEEAPVVGYTSPSRYGRLPLWRERAKHY